MFAQNISGHPATGPAARIYPIIGLRTKQPLLCFVTLQEYMKKTKTYLHERFASKDADANDAYLAKLRELANTHPELKNEYDTFRIYQAGFTNGVLNQVEAFYNMIINVRTHDEEKDGPFYRPEFEGVDGISYGKQTKFQDMTKQQFIDWVNTMAVNGDCPVGHWEDNEWGGLTYVFDKSHIKPKDIVKEND